MFDQIKDLPSKAVRIFKPGQDIDDARDTLKTVERSLLNEWTEGLKYATGAPSLDQAQTESLHTAIENLTECHTAIRRLVTSRVPISPQTAADIVATQLANTKQLAVNGTANSDRAANITTKTLNLLFAASQELHSRFGLKGHAAMTVGPGLVPEPGPTRRTGRHVMELPSAMMFELRQSLFPAERMIVGAGRRSDNVVTIEALFDVTGNASAGGVKAHPDRLGQALIAMSQSGTYFALWIHSHPGRGPGMTHPSSIDLRQHADWLKNYSPDLVSAIMVEDRYFRFWGTALEAGAMAVSITGDGVASVTADEHVYKLEV
ncbi:MAG: hypothetical protein IPM59_03305 [Chloracidobacterium sp.]|nr:hypothetical protein [Chloracidobacterium sp.]